MEMMEEGEKDIVSGIQKRGKVDGMIEIGGQIGKEIEMDIEEIMKIVVKKLIVQKIEY